MTKLTGVTKRPATLRPHDEAVYPSIADSALLAPSAVVVGNVKIGARSSVWHGAVIRADLAPITVGEDSNVQDGAILHVDAGRPCVIGSRVTIGHRAVVHGAEVGDEALVGIGAIVLSGAKVGHGAVVAAGAVVPEGASIPPGMVAVGVPARVRERVSGKLAARVAANWLEYVELARRTLARPNE